MLVAIFVANYTPEVLLEKLETLGLLPLDEDDAVKIFSNPFTDEVWSDISFSLGSCFQPLERSSDMHYPFPVFRQFVETIQKFLMDHMANLEMHSYLIRTLSTVVQRPAKGQCILC